MSVATELRLFVRHIEVLSRRLRIRNYLKCRVQVHNVRMVHMFLCPQSKREPSSPQRDSHSRSPKHAMPNLSSDSLIFYPAYCFPLSLTYNTWARLTAADVHALKEHEGYDSMFSLRLYSLAPSVHSYRILDIFSDDILE